MISKRLKDYIVRRREATGHKKRSWAIRIQKFGDIYISIPKRSELWGKLQAELLSRIQNHWKATYTYIRLETVYQDSYTEIFSEVQIEEIRSEHKGLRIFLFPDCRDRAAIEEIMSHPPSGGFTKYIFILDHRPEDWKGVMGRLYEITHKLLDGCSEEGFEYDLSGCKCLCLSLDEDLLIMKCDLEESVVLDIAADIAREEGLELVVTDERIRQG